MVAIVTGSGVGLERSSAFLLGAKGMFGDPTLGRAGDRVYVNGATGNLVIENQDEILMGRGPESAIGRTYNSLGTFAGETDNWRPSLIRQVLALTGTVNTAGSTVKRVDWDGTDALYVYDSTLGVYLSKAGSGAYDTLSFASNVWTWTDGDSRAAERYDWTKNGRIIDQADAAGNKITFSYTGNGLQLTRVTAPDRLAPGDGDYIDLAYDANGNLTSVVTYYNDPAGGPQRHLTRVYYGYDSSNRLTTVTTDLTPDDNAISDGEVYVTTYAYEGASKRISAITQSDGSSLQIGYTADGGVFRVTSLTETVAGASRTTGIVHDTTARTVTITDPLGQITVLKFETGGPLQQIIAPPAVTGGANQVFKFFYNANGDISQVVDGLNKAVVYSYDGSGNWISQRDEYGNTITRTYGSKNELLTETRYLAPDPDGGGALLPSAPVTTRYAYDANNHLRFAVSAEGAVTEFVYDSRGQQISRIDYAASRYDVAGLGTTATIAESTLASWVAGLTDRSAGQRVDTTYDFRGNVSTVTTYAALNSDGSIPASPVYTQTIYVYDQAGQLLSRQNVGSSATEHFVYDGMGRLVGSTDLAGGASSVVFNDAAGTTVVTLADGTVQTSTYNAAGELVSFATTKDGTTATTTYKYDPLGRPRVTTDATGISSHVLYDGDGRKVADIAADGATVEYVYDSNNRLRTIQYATRLTSGQVASLIDGTGNPANVSFGTLRPAGTPADVWAWNIYDSADRLIETIDGAGGVTVFTYDGASRLTSTTAYSTALLASTVADLKVTPPIALRIPTAAAATDRVVRNFYDADGRLVGTLDGSGALRQFFYDGAGRKVREIGYANRPDAGEWASGTFAQLLDGLAANASDSRVDWVYDGRGLVRFTVDARGRPTELIYDERGNPIRTIDYAATITVTAPPSLADVQAQISSGNLVSDPLNRITRSVYDAANRLAFTIDALGYVSSLSYDAAGRITKTVAFADAYSDPADPALGTMQGWATANAGDMDNRVVRSIYDPLGRLGFAIDGESYVTRYDYDAAGRVLAETRYADRYVAIDDSSVFAGVVALIGTPATAPAVTTFAYDAAGRLTDTTDAEGTVTHLVLDALGQVVSSTVAYGTADASTTTFVYDAAGRVTTQVRAAGTAEAVTLIYGYDGLGNQTTIDDDDGRISRRLYDQAGRVIQLRVPLNSSALADTYYEYDAFGHLAKTTDPRGNASYAYYDALGRLELQIDAEGYATQTSYTFAGEIANVKRFATATTGAALGARPALTADPTHDAVTTFTYDKLGRLLQSIDAEGHAEAYVLDAFGNRVVVDNKLGGRTFNQFDRRGLLLSETLPVYAYDENGNNHGDSYIINTFDYDGRGNLVTKVEAFGIPEARTTTYVYDKLDRLIEKIGEAPVNTHSWKYNGYGYDHTSYIPVERYTYDRRGNLVRTELLDRNPLTDQVVSATYAYFDGLDRKTAEISPVGTLSAWTYDVAGNVLSARVYGTAVLPPVTGSPIPVPGDSFRETKFTYDLNNRQTTSYVEDVRVGAFTGTSYATQVKDKVSKQTYYDAAGNVITSFDGRGVATLSYYDRLGRKIAEVDTEKYLTTWTYDAEGNVTAEMRYASALTITPSVTSTVASLQANAEAGSLTEDDRTTLFTYDRNGRRLTETRLGVMQATVNAISGSLSTIAESSTVSYTYNALGQVRTKTEANGDVSSFYYDYLGRLTDAAEQSFVSGTNQSGNPLVHSKYTQFFYDGLNNLVRTVENNNAGVGPSARVTKYLYDSVGRLNHTIDAEGNWRIYHYDIAGRVVGEGFATTFRNGSISSTRGIGYVYDAAGRVIRQTKIDLDSGMLELEGGDETNFEYNAYGEVVRRGINGMWQETFDYDNAGRIWRSTAGDGVARVYLYDGNGNQTLRAETEGVSTALSSAGSVTAALGLTGTGNETLAGASLPDFALTYTQYDRRNQATFTREPFRDGFTTPIDRVRSYNAFGEVLSETDGRGNTTDYVYNSMGRLVETKHPQVSYTLENGSILAGRPTETNYYDISGRLVGTRDANGNLTTRLLLAGSGHCGEEALTVKEFHPDGGVVETLYDYQSNAVAIINELGAREDRTYDRLGQLTSIIRPQRLAGPSYVAERLTERFQYDALGRVIRRSNSLFDTLYGTGEQEITEYDLDGRVTYTRAFGGIETSYVYTWNAAAATAGLATFGGWTKTTTNDAGLVATETTDVFGRMVAREDFGGHDYAYAYDKAGRVVGQSVTDGTTTATTATEYYNTGRVKKVTTGTAVSGFTYDKDGNRLTESHTIGGISHQNATATWDAMNRMVSLADSGAPGGNGITIAYEYDLVGNVRYTLGTYHGLNDAGGAMSATSTQDYWYKYDSMNRFVTVKGVLEGSRGSGTITSGFERVGMDITYDLAGQRKTTTRHHHHIDEWGEIYDWATTEISDYTTDGFLERSTTDNLWRAESKLDLMGRELRYWEYNGGTTYMRYGADSFDVDPGDAAVADFSGSPQDIQYDAAGRIYDTRTGLATSGYGWQTTVTKSGNTFYRETSRLEYDAAGQLKEQYTDKLKDNTATGPWDDDGDDVRDYRTTWTYGWWDTAQVVHANHDRRVMVNDNALYDSTYALDVAGRTNSVFIDDGRDRMVSFVYNGAGQVLRRSEDFLNSSDQPTDLHYYFDGRTVADLTNNGTLNIEYAGVISQRGTSAGTGNFRNGAVDGYPSADFDQSYDAINDDLLAGTGTSYTASAGDTLQGIAAELWGDASLWYMIAEANGLSGNEALAEGRVLAIPNKVHNFHNSADTWRPYDPNEALGDLSPTRAPKPKKGKNCGGLGAVLLAVVAVAVAAVTAGAAVALTTPGLSLGGGIGVALGGSATLGAAAGALAGATVTATGVGLATFGAIGAAVGSVVSQGLGVATGLQDKFSWKAVGLSAIAGGVGGGFAGLDVFGKAATGLAKFANVAARGALGSAVGQGIGLATGLQDRFSWAGVASGAAGAGFRGALGDPILSGMAGGIAASAAESLITGDSFGDTLMRSLPSIIGNTVGNIVADSLTRSPKIAYGEVGSDDGVTGGAAVGGASGAGDGTLARPVAGVAGGGQVGGSDDGTLPEIVVIADPHQRDMLGAMSNYQWGRYLGEAGPQQYNEGTALWALGLQQPYSGVTASFGAVSSYDSPLIQSLKTARPYGLYSDGPPQQYMLGDGSVFTGTPSALASFKQQRAAQANMAYMDRITGSTFGGIALGVSNSMGASPATQDLLYGLGSSADGMLLSGAALRGGSIGPFTGRSSLNIVNGENGVHANSRLSGRTTWLYELQTSDGQFLKYGISVNPNTRYSNSFMVGKRIIPITSGTRSDMLAVERQMVIANPGPLNNEPWAVKARKGK